jgi:hypothetical protein
MHAYHDKIACAFVRLDYLVGDAHYRPPDVFGGHQDALRHTKKASSLVEKGSPARRGW